MIELFDNDIIEHREEIILLVIAILIPLITLPAMLGM